MWLNVHDFSGHPFQVQLSRALAGRGHGVLHGYSTQFVTGHGRLEVTSDDPSTLRIEGIEADVPMIKYHPLLRTRFEVAYATAWKKALRRERFDVVVACNVPLFTLARVQRQFARTRQPWVLWHQDLYSLGVGAEAERRLPGVVAPLARRGVEWLEKVQVRDATAVVSITDAMVERYRVWGVGRDDVHVIPNWAPLDDVVPGDRDNRWAKQNDLPEDAVRLVYAGTLGRKHNPLLLLELLDAAKARGVNAHLVVVSEGCGAEELRAAAGDRSDVQVFGFQPAEEMTDLLASADAVVTLLEADAAEFSVPSKVLTYLAAARPIIALMPHGNPAARDVADAGGFTGEPTGDGARAAAAWLEQTARDPEVLAAIGDRGRALATARFDIERITDRFEQVLTAAAERRASHGPLIVTGGIPRSGRSTEVRAFPRRTVTDDAVRHLASTGGAAGRLDA